MKRIARALLTIALLSGCRSTPTNSGDSDEFLSDRMREACPTLPDEALASYVAAIDQLRMEGLTEEDALIAWVQGCESIPPDGNFGGNKDLCATCLAALVEEVYR